ncbi:hypothetical protein ACFE04_018533 [Oxalis oulophora]
MGGGYRRYWMMEFSPWLRDPSSGHLQSSGLTSFVGQYSAPHSKTYLAEDDLMGLADGEKRLWPTILSDADVSLCRDSNTISLVTFVMDHALSRRKNNIIRHLRDDSGNMVSDQANMNELVKCFYQSLFKGGPGVLDPIIDKVS